MQDKNPLDLISVRFGDEITQARPFDFLTDEEGDLIRPSKAITSCPYCGHGNEINLLDDHTLTIKNGETIIEAWCSNCGAGNSSWQYTDGYSLNSNIDTVSVNRDTSYIDKDIDDLDRDVSDIEREVLESLYEDDTPKIKTNSSGSITIDESKEVQTLKSNCPFVDPVQMGTFVIDEI